MTAAPDRRTWVEQVMGLPVSLLARGAQVRSAAAEQAARAVYDELRQVDAVLSPYKEDSALSRYVRGETGLDDPWLREAAERCEQARALTGGLFDATRPDGRWDPSGLVKGWAVERASRHLADCAGLDWCLNAGGDVVVLCPSGGPFTVGIQDPADEGRLVAALPLAAGAVATSGTAARGEHLYDPRSGTAATALASVSVTGPSLETADVLATAAFVAGDAALDVARAVPGYEALRVDLDGRLTATDGWQGVPV